MRYNRFDTFSLKPKITQYIAPASVDDRVIEILNRFQNEPRLKHIFLQVEQNTAIERVEKLIQTRNHAQLYDDVCVTDKGRYQGIVSVGDILNAIMENNLILAIGANPLSGLPGNDYIQRKIREVSLTRRPSQLVKYPGHAAKRLQEKKVIRCKAPYDLCNS